MTDKEERLFQEINEYARDKGLHLEGYIPARCPIYVLNLSYFSKDNDPFYPIDRAIINILYHNPHTTGIPYIAWLLGFEKEIVESRINYHLIADGFLRYGGHGEYVVTDAGARKWNLIRRSSFRRTPRCSSNRISDGRWYNSLIASPDILQF